MRKRVLGMAAAALLLAGGGAFAWSALRPPPPPPPAPERGLDEIPPDEYEKWMQDLGYTE